MFVKLTLHPSGEQKFYNMRYVKSFRQEKYSTILELPEGTENVKEKAKDIYRILDGEIVPEIGDTVRVYTDAHAGELGEIVDMHYEGEDDLYVVRFEDSTSCAMSEDCFCVIR